MMMNFSADQRQSGTNTFSQPGVPPSITARHQ